jgi:neutral trehalase
MSRAILLCVVVAVGVGFTWEPSTTLAAESSNVLWQTVEIDVATTLARLLAEEETDGDRKITVADPPIKDTPRGDKRFTVIATDGRRYELIGVYPLSNLLQELALASAHGRTTLAIEGATLYENPVDRISRMIRTHFWDNLTRRIDANSLASVLVDPKARSDLSYLYVPAEDTAALDYFRAAAAAQHALKLEIVALPREITPDYVRGLDGRHGLLALALQRDAAGNISGVPYVVPGGRFNEMYGWGQFLRSAGSDCGQARRSGQGHGRQLRLSDHALRQDPQREPHLLPDTIPTAVPDRDDPRRPRRAAGG